jgi:hypothetical protein
MEYITKFTEEIEEAVNVVKLVAVILLFVVLGFVLSFVCFSVSYLIAVLNYISNSQLIDFYFPFYLHWSAIFTNLHYFSWILINDFWLFLTISGFWSSVIGYFISLMVSIFTAFRLKRRGFILRFFGR